MSRVFICKPWTWKSCFARGKPEVAWWNSGASAVIFCIMWLLLFSLSCIYMSCYFQLIIFTFLWIYASVLLFYKKSCSLWMLCFNGIIHRVVAMTVFIIHRILQWENVSWGQSEWAEGSHKSSECWNQPHRISDDEWCAAEHGSARACWVCRTVARWCEMQIFNVHLKTDRSTTSC